MKTILHLFVFLTFSGTVCAQSNYYETVMDNPYGDYQFLYELPWDQSQLIQVKREAISLPQFHFVYEFETISNGLSAPYYIPFCADISAEPVFFG